MKRTILTIILLITTLTYGGHEINWSTSVEFSYSKNIISYIGNIGEENYYCVFNSSFMKDKLLLFSSTAGKMNEIPKDEINFSRNSFQEITIGKQNLYALLTEDNKENKSFTNLVLQTIDKNTFELKDKKVLFSFPDKRRVELINSKYNNKHLVYYFDYTNRMKNKGTIVLNMYDADFNLLWHKTFDNTTSVDLNIRKFCVTEQGQVIMLSTYGEKNKGLFKKNIKYPESILLTYFDSESKYNRSLEFNEIINSINAEMIDNQRVLLVFNNESSLKAFDMNIVTNQTHKVIEQELPNAYFKRSKVTPQWHVNDILKLDNGNYVVFTKDIFILDCYTNGSFKAEERYDKNMNLICFNLDNKNVVYNKTFDRGIAFVNKKGMYEGDYELAYCFSKGNDVYVLFNNNVKTDLMDGNLTKDVKVMLPKDYKKAVSQLLKINPNGETQLETIVKGKEDKTLVATSMCRLLDNGELLLNCRNKKGFITAKINL